MRVAYYAGVSTAAAAACLIKAFHERPNFYSATVYLSQSNACLLILTNYLLMLACGMVYGLQRLLYGPLRPIEIEHLSERAWYAVLDTLLAMPSFKEDVGGWLLTMFVLLLAGKVWGWIGEGRVDILEQQPPANPRLFHTRLANSLVFSVIFDVLMTKYCFSVVAADPRPGMMVIFTFEFAILTVFSTFTLCRYILSLISIVITQRQTVQAIAERKAEILAQRAAVRARAISSEGDETSDMQQEEPIEIDENEVDVPGWEEKRRWLFGLEMTSDFLKLLLYIVFFSVSIAFNGLPMHIMRDVYMTFAAFTKRLGDYVNYKKATSDMNSRYPDATTAEIRDDACIVCREDMIAWNDESADQENAGAAARPRRDEGLRAKKLPCGHILHLRCLKAWLERQQVCPTCRRPVISATPVPNNAQANVVPAVQPAAPRNQARPPANPNRARFFNLGPLRVGFLNGPPDQVNNMVNQWIGDQPPQVQAPNNVNTAPVAPQATSAGAPSARISQDELQRFSQRIQQEASVLNVEQAQLHVIRAMSQEFDRLTVLHNHNTATGQVLNVSTPSARQPSGTPVPFVGQHLTGLHARTIHHDSPTLPSGIVLPEGWTLMPLRQEVARQIPQPQHVVPQMHLHQHAAMHAHALLAAQQANARAQDAGVAPVITATVAAAEDAAQESLSHQSADTSTGPVDAEGSPLFVPTTVAGASSTDSNKTSDAAVAPQAWTSQDWKFPSQPQQTDSHDDTTEEPDRRDKGKGRAVAMEEVTDQDL